MLDHVDLNSILFLDIETVSGVHHFEELDDDFRELWALKSKFFREKEELTLEESYERAGIYAEFGKIVCISVGYFHYTAGRRIFRVTSFYGNDESELLQRFSNLLNSHFSSPAHLLCAHNGKEFDFPARTSR